MASSKVVFVSRASRSMKPNIYKERERERKREGGGKEGERGR
jgi:hypothetical protein